MDQAGLINKVLIAVADINYGRKGLAINGMEHEGRVSYETGISNALSSFQEAHVLRNPKTLILAELTFLQQEFQFCNEADTFALSSLTQAIQSFDDALRSLEAVEDPGYKVAEKTYSQNPKYRVNGCPKDVFHQACAAHRTRLQNVLRSPGINLIEKDVLHQRIANMTAAQKVYNARQKIALDIC